jgi:uncharacterized protein YggT (Ycf19 family)
MVLVDFILNLAALLVWVSWRQAGFKPAIPQGISLAGTLKPAGAPGSRWRLLAGLAALLFIRAIFYWESGPATQWTAGLGAGPIILHFRSDLFHRMLLYSLLSFGQFLGLLYVWLLLLSAVNHRMPEATPHHRWVRLHLGRVDGWPVWLKLLLPFAGALAVWSALSPLFIHLGLLPPAESTAAWTQRGAIVSAAVYLTWRYLIATLLLLDLLGTHVYFGQSKIWDYFHETARKLLRPLQWLPIRLGRLDFRPLAGIIVVLAVGEYARRILAFLYERI